MERMRAEMNFFEAYEKPEHCNVYLLVEMGQRSSQVLLITECKNAVDVVINQLGHDAVNRLRRRLEKASSTVRFSCFVALATFLWCFQPVYARVWRGAEGNEYRNR